MKNLRAALCLLLPALLFSCFPNKDFFDGERTARLTEILAMPSSIDFNYSGSPPTRVDLVPSTTSLSSTVLLPGSSYTVDYTVLNNGLLDSVDSFEVMFCLATVGWSSCDSPGSDYDLGTDTITEFITAGGGISHTGVSVTVPPAIPSGSYYLCKNVDWNKVVAENSESNNYSCSSSKSIKIAASGRDLRPQSISLSTENPVAGSSYTVDFTVQNIGADDVTTPFDVEICLSTYSWSSCYGYSYDYALGTDTVSETVVGAGSVTHTGIPVTLPGVPAGNYHLCINVDVNSAVGEISESNNYVCTSTEVAVSIPDIDLQPTGLSISSTTVEMGQSYTVDYTVQNSGTVDVNPGEDIETRFYLSYNSSCTTSDVLLGSDIINGGVGAGGSINRTAIPVTIPTMSAMDYYLCAIVDPDGTIPDTNTTNNALAVTPLVTVITSQIDLIPVSATLSSASVLTGTSYTIDYTITNQGTTDFGGSIDVTVYFYTTSYCGSVNSNNVIATDTIGGGLAAGASANRTGIPVQIPDIIGRDYYLCLYIDPAHNIPESDDYNNYSAYGTVAVSLPPDSYEPDDNKNNATGITTDGSPQDHNLHDPTDVDYLSFTVDSTTDIYVIEVSDGSGGCNFDSVLNLYDTNGVSPLISDSYSGSYPCPKIEYIFSSTGTYYVKVSSPNSYNSGNYTITVHKRAPADLTVEINSVSGDGYQVTINYTIHNIGSGDAVSGFYIDVEGWANLAGPPLITDFGPGWDSVSSSSINSGGGNYTGQLTVYSSLLSGTAYVTVDRWNDEIESDETNNVSAGFSWP